MKRKYEVYSESSIQKTENELTLGIRGAQYIQQGNLEAALKDLNRLIQLNPNNSGALALRGNVYCQQGNFEAALNDLNRSIQLNPNSSGALAWRGDVYCHQGNFELALNDLNRSIQLNPNNHIVLEHRAHIYKSLGNEKEAILNQFKAYRAQLKENKINNVPSLASFCKWVFFKEESTIYTQGKIFKVASSTSHNIRDILANQDINPITLATMREEYNKSPAFNSSNSVFNQLDLIDIKLKF